jgi:hypothetical protein
MQLNNKSENERVINAIFALDEINAKFSALKKKYEVKKAEYEKEIKNFMFVNGIDGLKFDNNELNGKVNYDVKFIKQKKVIFDADKLEQVIDDKELLNEIIIKNYTITDMEGLIKYLKSCGVNPKIFKQYIKVDKSVDTATMDRLFDIGEIKMKDVKGTYTVKENAGYIKISKE